MLCDTARKLVLDVVFLLFVLQEGRRKIMSKCVCVLPVLVLDLDSDLLVFAVRLVLCRRPLFEHL